MTYTYGASATSKAKAASMRELVGAHRVAYDRIFAIRVAEFGGLYPELSAAELHDKARQQAAEDLIAITKGEYVRLMRKWMAHHRAVPGWIEPRRAIRRRK